MIILQHKTFHFEEGKKCNMYFAPFRIICIKNGESIIFESNLRKEDSIELIGEPLDGLDSAGRTIHKQLSY